LNVPIDMTNNFHTQPPDYGSVCSHCHSLTTTYHGDSERNSLLVQPKASHTKTKLLYNLLIFLGFLAIIQVVPTLLVSITGVVREREARLKERAAYNLEREAVAAEREQWRKERADYENRQRRKEDEKRSLLVWQDLKASSRCLRYGTREYSATLTHVALGLDPLKECWKKGVDIHGRHIFPSRCDTVVRLFNLHHPIFNFGVPSQFSLSGNVRRSYGPLGHRLRRGHMCYVVEGL
jgi:hypothetical protein